MLRGIILFLAAAAAVGAQTASFVVDGSKLGKIVGNKADNMNLWNGLNISPADTSEGVNLGGIVDYVQIMQATGGSYDRDPFKDPRNTAVLDDYDFSRLISTCKTILGNGQKPHLKFSVPTKYAKGAKGVVFNANVYPPDDYEVYYKFIDAFCKELVKNFGREELLTWRYGVLTEFDNKDWFIARDGKPESTKLAYFKLYDYTVDALQKNIGENVFVGAHAMLTKGAFWDARELIDHCAKGENLKTKKTGTRINFFAVSFYDTTPQRANVLTLIETVAPIQKRANELGLNLIYGVDEGRILYGRKGRVSKEISSRVVADSFQAGHDSYFIKQMADGDIDYFSAWTLTAGDPFKSFPTVSYHVAKAAAHFRNAQRAEVVKVAKGGADCETDAVAGYDAAKKEFYLLAYNFKRQLEYKTPARLDFTLKLPMFAGREVKIVRCGIDDSSGNFYPQFAADKKERNVPDTVYDWSPDTCSIDSVRYSPEGKEFFEFYRKNLRAKYVKLAQLKERNFTAEVASDGTLTLTRTIPGNGAIFWKISE